MIAETWDFKFDILKLQKHLQETVFCLPITAQSEAFGGWSVLSSKGDYRDGWQKGHFLYNPNIGEEKKSEIQKTLTKPFSEYTTETEICTGYLKEVIDFIRSKDLKPARARISRLASGHSSSWHIDSQDHTYFVRLHIPIFTNEKCFFQTRDESQHLPADGSAYFLYVNREHRVVNDGDTDRYHLIMDVVDLNQNSKFHRREDFYNK